jgi:hypothetical protein
MAGFAQAGSPGFQISPPRINPMIGPGHLRLGGISRNTGGGAGFLNNEVASAMSQIDTSPQHQANVYLAQMGLGRTVIIT